MSLDAAPFPLPFLFFRYASDLVKPLAAVTPIKDLASSPVVHFPPCSSIHLLGFFPGTVSVSLFNIGPHPLRPRYSNFLSSILPSMSVDQRVNPRISPPIFIGKRWRSLTKALGLFSAFVKDAAARRQCIYGFVGKRPLTFFLLSPFPGSTPSYSVRFTSRSPVPPGSGLFNYSHRVPRPRGQKGKCVPDFFRRFFFPS